MDKQKEIAFLKGHADALVFSPDGKILASGSQDNTIRLWDLASRQEKVAVPTRRVYCLAFSPDGKTLASGHDDGTIQLWSMGPKLDEK